MRSHRAPSIVLTTLLLALLATGLAGSAAAGGPTSVMLVAPETGDSTALHIGNPDYDALADLVGAFDGTTGVIEPPQGASNDGAAGTNDTSGPGVTLTWLIHDVSVWRVDRVYLQAEGGVLISTQTRTDDGNLWASPPTWRRLDADGPALAQLLDRLGVGSTTPGAASTQPFRADGPSSATLTAATVPSSTAGWFWAPVGLLAGIALTLAARRWSGAGRSARC